MVNINSKIKTKLQLFIRCILLICIYLLFAKIVRSYVDLSKKEECERNSIKQTIHSIEKTTYEDNVTPFDTGEHGNQINNILNPNIMNSDMSEKTEAEIADNTTNDDSIDCIISIPDIDLYKYVYTGKNRIDYLEQYNLVTSANDMLYKNGGNYIICGHASRLYGHSLNRLKEIKIGTNIYIYSQNSVYKYIVKEVAFEDKKNTQSYYEQTQKKQITIVSCAKYISEESYIIVRAEFQNK